MEKNTIPDHLQQLNSKSWVKSGIHHYEPYDEEDVRRIQVFMNNLLGGHERLYVKESSPEELSPHEEGLYEKAKTVLRIRMHGRTENLMTVVVFDGAVFVSSLHEATANLVSSINFSEGIIYGSYQSLLKHWNGVLGSKYNE